MHKFSTLIASLVVVCGCATTLPLSELRYGQSVDEVKDTIGRSPAQELQIIPPGGSEPSLLALEYQDETTPHWFLFHEGTLWGHGEGDIRSAEIVGTNTYFDIYADQNLITHAEAERYKLETISKVYGLSMQPEYEDYYAFRIQAAESLDAGDITKSEFASLVTAKETQLAKRIADAEYQAATAAAAQQQAQQAQALLLMGLGTQLLETSQPPPMPIINCRSTQQGVFTNTTCY